MQCENLALSICFNVYSSVRAHSRRYRFTLDERVVHSAIACGCGFVGAGVEEKLRHSDRVLCNIADIGMFHAVINPVIVGHLSGRRASSPRHGCTLTTYTRGRVEGSVQRVGSRGFATDLVDDATSCEIQTVNKYSQLAHVVVTALPLFLACSGSGGSGGNPVADGGAGAGQEGGSGGGCPGGGLGKLGEPCVCQTDCTAGMRCILARCHEDPPSSAFCTSSPTCNGVCGELAPTCNQFGSCFCLGQTEDWSCTPGQTAGCPQQNDEMVCNYTGNSCVPQGTLLEGEPCNADPAKINGGIQVCSIGLVCVGNDGNFGDETFCHRSCELTQSTPDCDCQPAGPSDDTWGACLNSVDGGP
jgi:hypothetical protein